MKKTLNEVMEGLRSVTARYYWCNARACCCLGCCNTEVLNAGYTKENWEEWVRENPQPEVVSKGTSYN